jgi:hypothetical protein
VLTDPDGGDTVEAPGLLDQGSLALGQDRVREVVHDDGLECPPQPATRELRSRFGGTAGVLAPHVAATAAPVAADRHHERRGAPAERLVRQTTCDGVAGGAFAAAAAAPPLLRIDGLDDAAGEHSSVGSNRWQVTTRPSSSRRQKVLGGVEPGIDAPTTARSPTP